MTDEELKATVKLVKELRAALALERGGGSPLTARAYINLDTKAKDFIATHTKV